MKRFIVIQDSKEPFGLNSFNLETEFDHDDNMIVLDTKYNNYCVDGKVWNPVK